MDIIPQFEDVLPLLMALPPSPPPRELYPVEIDMPDVNSAALEQTQQAYARARRDTPEMLLIPLPPTGESSPMDIPIDLPTDIPVNPWRGLDPLLGGPLTEEWRQRLADNPPSQAVTHPVSPSQPNSPAK